jgi:hypothetical protein
MSTKITKMQRQLNKADRRITRVARAAGLNLSSPDLVTTDDEDEEDMPGSGAVASPASSEDVVAGQSSQKSDHAVLQNKREKEGEESWQCVDMSASLFIPQSPV